MFVGFDDNSEYTLDELTDDYARIIRTRIYEHGKYPEKRSVCFELDRCTNRAYRLERGVRYPTNHKIRNSLFDYLLSVKGTKMSNAKAKSKYQSLVDYKSLDEREVKYEFVRQSGKHIVLRRLVKDKFSARKTSTNERVETWLKRNPRQYVFDTEKNVAIIMRPDGSRKAIASIQTEIVNFLQEYNKDQVFNGAKQLSFDNVKIKTPRKRKPYHPHNNGIQILEDDHSLYITSMGNIYRPIFPVQYKQAYSDGSQLKAGDKVFIGTSHRDTPTISIHNGETSEVWFSHGTKGWKPTEYLSWGK